MSRLPALLRAGKGNRASAARKNEGGAVVCANYGRVTSLALDPIEEAPRALPSGQLYPLRGQLRLQPSLFLLPEQRYLHGGRRCRLDLCFAEARAAAAREKARGNIGLAFTYNEPLIGYEYVYDCALLAHEEGLKIVLVTNGTVCEEPLLKLLPFVDAMNIDLKAFTEEAYQKLGGWLDVVKRTIERSAQACHVEVTTLVVPGFNDSEREMEREAAWLASLDPNIPLHISRFFPCYRMRDASPTPVPAVYRLRDIAAKKLNYIYTGNC